MFVQVLFSVTFALSCTMFELIIFEILGIMAAKYDTFNLLVLSIFEHPNIFLLLSTFLCLSFYQFFFLLFSSRYFHWQLNLYLILVILIVVIPLYISNQVARGLPCSKYIPNSFNYFYH